MTPQQGPGGHPRLEAAFALPPNGAAQTPPTAELTTKATVDPTADSIDGTAEKVVASNLRLPEALKEQVSEECNRRGITTGEFIIAAIEDTYDRLRGYVHPAGTIGGRLFTQRGVGSARPTTATTTKQVAFSLRAADFAVLDALATEFSARNRAHIITAALTAYFATIEQGD